MPKVYEKEDSQLNWGIAYGSQSWTEITRWRFPLLLEG